MQRDMQINQTEVNKRTGDVGWVIGGTLVGLGLGILAWTAIADTKSIAGAWMGKSPDEPMDEAIKMPKMTKREMAS